MIRLKVEFPDKADDIILINADCNTYLQDLCLNYKWNSNRAVLFLDPFGMQVEWETIEAIASTKAIDLWILFPLGVAVNRMLKRDGMIGDSWKSRLDELFGTEDWYDRFYKKKSVQTLFGEEMQTQKTGHFDTIADFYLERLSSVFPSVAKNPLYLKNSRNNPLYLLCFATANPNAKSALRIAQDILGR